MPRDRKAGFSNDAWRKKSECCTETVCSRTGAVERLGIPELKMADGPLGVREEISRDNWAPAGLTRRFCNILSGRRRV
jgi:hypothetical protein